MRSRGSFALLLSGAGFFGRACLGRARLPVPGGVFARAVLRAVRPHFFAFPAAAALSGAASSGRRDHPLAIALGAAAVAVGWGVGQLLNDIGDVEADVIDAPDRPAVTGELPAAPGAAVAIVLGLGVAAALGSLHPAGWALALGCACLLFVYPLAKPLPGLGNLAHGALMSAVSVIGFAAASPTTPLTTVLRGAWPIALVTGLTAALYLEANYEKDRAGDATAGVRTLAHVLGIRGSALLRGAMVIGVAVSMSHLELLPSQIALGLASSGALLVLISAITSLRGNDEKSALAGYPWAIHGTTALLLAPAAPMLGAIASLGLFAGAIVLVERAFRRSANP